MASGSEPSDLSLERPVLGSVQPYIRMGHFVELRKSPDWLVHRHYGCCLTISISLYG